MSRLGIYASSVTAGLVSNSFESIATVSVGAGGSGTITFSSIPSTFKHLQIRAIARGGNADLQTTFRIRLNSDASAAYTYHRLRGDGSTITATGSGLFNESYLYFGAAGTSAGSNVFGASIWDFYDYASTSKNKVIKYLGGTESNGTGGIALGSGAWLNTSAINAITLTADGGSNFVQYSQFALYGLKG